MNTTMNVLETSPVDGVTATGPDAGTAVSWFSATDLAPVELPGISSDEDVILEGKAYRRLTPASYAWLRRQMDTARERYQRGLLPETHEPLKTRCHAMHEMAVMTFGDAALWTACAVTTLLTYAPPIVRMSREVSVVLQDAKGNTGQAPQTGPSPAPGARNTADMAGDAPMVGLPVQSSDGQWGGVIVRQYPADDWFPHGWAEIRCDDGQYGRSTMPWRRDEIAGGTRVVTSPVHAAHAGVGDPRHMRPRHRRPRYRDPRLPQRDDRSALGVAPGHASCPGRETSHRRREWRRSPPPGASPRGRECGSYSERAQENRILAMRLDRDPNAMAPEERLEELRDILAHGIVRLVTSGWESRHQVLTGRPQPSDECQPRPIGVNAPR
ncbi:MAG: hypothetical protein ACOYOU_20555 [Kiritimatiellia bacterium]